MSSGRKARDPIGRPLLVGDRLDAGDQVAAHALVVLGIDRALGLAALHVHEAAAVVAAVTPRLGVRPVDLHLADRRRRARRILESEVPLAHQPLVEADAAFHALRAVIGDHEHERIARHQTEQRRQLAVEVAVVVADRLLEGVAALVLVVLRIHVAPEPVMDAVEPHLDHHEVVPRVGGDAGAWRPSSACASWCRRARAARSCAGVRKSSTSST